MSEQGDNFRTLIVKNNDLNCNSVNIVIKYLKPSGENDEKRLKMIIKNLVNSVKNKYCEKIDRMVNNSSSIIHDKLTLLISFVINSNYTGVAVSYYSEKNPEHHTIVVKSIYVPMQGVVDFEVIDYQNNKILFMKHYSQLVKEYQSLIILTLNLFSIIQDKQVLSNNIIKRIVNQATQELSAVSYFSPNIYKKYSLKVQYGKVMPSSFTFGISGSVKKVNKAGLVSVEPVVIKSTIIREDSDWELVRLIKTIIKQKMNRFKIVNTIELPMSSGLMNQLIQTILYTDPKDGLSKEFNFNNIKITVNNYIKLSITESQKENLNNTIKRIVESIRRVGFDDDSIIQVDLSVTNNHYIGMKLYDAVTLVKVNFIVVKNTVIYSVTVPNVKTLKNIRAISLIIKSFTLMSLFSQRGGIQVIPLYLLRFRGEELSGVNNNFTIENKKSAKFGFFTIIPKRKITPKLEAKAIMDTLIGSTSDDDLLLKSISIFEVYNLLSIFNNIPDYLNNLMTKTKSPVNVSEKRTTLNSEHDVKKTGGDVMSKNPLSKASFSPGIPLPDEFDFEEPASKPETVKIPQTINKSIKTPPKNTGNAPLSKVQSNEKKPVGDSIPLNKLPELWLSNILNNLNKLKISQQQYYYIQQSITESHEVMKKALSHKSNELLLTINLPTNIISVIFKTGRKTIPIWVLKYLVKESLLIIRSSMYLPFTPSMTFETSVNIVFDGKIREELVFSITRRNKRLNGLPSYNDITNNLKLNPILSTVFSVGNNITLIEVMMDKKNNSLNYSNQELSYLFSMFLKGVNSIMGTSIPQFLMRNKLNVNGVISTSLKTLYDILTTSKLPRAVYHIEFINNYMEFIRTGDKSKGDIRVSVVSNNVSPKTLEKYEQFIYSKLLSFLKL